MTENELGNLIALKIWERIQQEKRVEHTPWVTNPKSDKYDAHKHGFDMGKKYLIEAIEDIVYQHTNEEHSNQVPNDKAGA